MVKLLIAFLIIALIKFVLNAWKYRQCKRFQEEYLAHMKEANWKMTEDMFQVRKLFEDAGIEDATFIDERVNLYGVLTTSHPSVFRNMALRRQDVGSLVLPMFYKSIGVYKSRMWETINPLYWIETIIYLPKRILSYLGIPPEKRITNILQVVYWVLSGLVTLALTVFQPEIQQLVKGWLSK